MLGAFKTKKAIKEHAQKILRENKDKTLEGDDLIFIKELLDRHPDRDEKIGVGIKEIKVTRTMFNSYGFYITRLDNSIIDFSYLACIRGTAASERTNLLAAMRHAVMGQAIGFKKENYNDTFICPLCNSIITESKDIHADHFGKKFRDISSEFLINRNDVPKDFDDSPSYHVAIFKDNDYKFKQEWINFHAENCSLRLICSRCSQLEG